MHNHQNYTLSHATPLGAPTTTADRLHAGQVAIVTSGAHAGEWVLRTAHGPLISLTTSRMMSDDAAWPVRLIIRGESVIVQGGEPCTIH